MATAVHETTLGRGVYGARELARYVALQHGKLAGRRCRRWLREMVRPAGHVRRWRADYSFGALVTVLAVAELSSSGLPIARIATAHKRLARFTGVEQPFALRGLFTDGERIGVQLGDDRLTDLTHGDGLVDRCELVPLELAGVTFESGVRITERPAVWWSSMPGVTLHPQIQGGAPCLSETRIQTRVMHLRYDDGETLQELHADFDYLDSGAIPAALAFERRLRELGR